MVNLLIEKFGETNFLNNSISPTAKKYLFENFMSMYKSIKNKFIGENNIIIEKLYE